VVKALREFDRAEAKIAGQIWTAVPDGGGVIAEGSVCEILRVEGVKLVVRRLPDSGNDIGIADGNITTMEEK